MRGFFRRLRGPRFAVTFRRARHFAFSDLLFLLPELTRLDPELEGALRALLGHVDPATTRAWQRLLEAVGIEGTEPWSSADSRRDEERSDARSGSA